ncbi:MAG: serine hydrolase domain-containing protein [Dissulfurispiraceae bacterium]|jgi:D-alanyl-D-alanine carboxypeptidase
MKRYGKYSRISLLLMFIAAFALTACGGSSGGSGTTVVSGVASKGLIQGATVSVASYAGGATGTTLGSSQTLSDGSYSVSIGSYSGPVLVTVTGGSYKDETTLKNTALTIPLHAIYSNASGNVSIMVTPLTEEAYQYAQVKFGSNLTTYNMDFANAKISNYAGFDIIATSPVDPTSAASASAPEASKEYGIYLTYFSGSGGLDNITSDMNNYTLMDELTSDNTAAVIKILSNFLSSSNNQTGITNIKNTNEYLSLTVEPIMDNALRTNNVPGLILAFKLPGRTTWVGASGFSDLSTGAPMTGNDVLRIGSISKTFVATEVIYLAQEGYFSLDDPIAKWLPQVTSMLPKYNWSAITIREVLDHTSGIYAYTADTTFQTDFAVDPLMQWTYPELLQIVNTDRGPLFTPGTSWSYSNTDYTLLGMLIEQITGGAWEDEVASTCINRLGLQNTFIPKTGDVSMHSTYFAHGYVNWESNFNADSTVTIPDSLGFLTERTAEDPSFANSAGAVISTPSDLVVWGRELALGGTILNPTYQAQRLTYFELSKIDPGYAGYGYGLGIMHEGPLLGHRGQIYGYDCTVQYLPSQDTTFAACLNRTVYTTPIDETFTNVNSIVLYNVINTLFSNAGLLNISEARQIRPSGAAAVPPTEY